MHELGHALGLGHSADATSVMYATLGAGVANRVMTSADLNVPDFDNGACGLHAARARAVTARVIAPVTAVLGGAALSAGQAWTALDDLAAHDVALSQWPGSRAGTAKRLTFDGITKRGPSPINRALAGSLSAGPSRTVLQAKIVDLALDGLGRRAS
jgi:hypothetical protein